ncbi:peptide/nickel transport system permease protein [Rhodobacter viridis]|uniref:Peptide/nickel transport system permease protein n=1 Tax=Rhodobacter viridis TaxID=1054202 RepID=A0A318U2H4_9RHOB|nr:ABC transporter permease [Rhodobacter viridis]PYF12660.1 peptide/nickel transport system permease protein [Rhodobacter viridis]
MSTSAFHRPEARIGAALLAALGLLALLAPVLSPGDPLAISGLPLVLPFTEALHPLGTDRLGRDLMAGLIHGARISMTVGLLVALVALTAGMLVGTLAGLIGGWTEAILMRIVEAFQIVPGFLLALAFVSVTGPRLSTVVVAIALGAWTGPARLARARVLVLRESDFVAAARVLGHHPLEIALRQVLPLALPPVLSLTAIIVAGAILTEAALSFLGLGNPNAVTWGAMIAEGRNQLRSAAWLSVLPGLALLLTVVAIYLLGEAVADSLGARDRR